uniref:Uncharacterized protein n=1 Tax=Arundo donax TaxID=35708 RepID=A0A0A8ZP69_ARUDO
MMQNNYTASMTHASCVFF